MSRAFMRNNEAAEPIVVVPPRPPLPGPVNYVTPRGLALLRGELTRLEARRAEVQARNDDSADTRAELVSLASGIADLQQRIVRAQVVEPRKHDVVRFGSTVLLRIVSGASQGFERQLTIVGVDEAAARQGRIAFNAPIARAVLGLKVGETGVVATPQSSEVVEVRAIT